MISSDKHIKLGHIWTLSDTSDMSDNFAIRHDGTLADLVLDQVSDDIRHGHNHQTQFDIISHAPWHQTCPMHCPSDTVGHPWTWWCKLGQRQTGPGQARDTPDNFACSQSAKAHNHCNSITSILISNPIGPQLLQLRCLSSSCHNVCFFRFFCGWWLSAAALSTPLLTVAPSSPTAKVDHAQIFASSPAVK